ncbi:Carbon-nitrogen hydrolase [Thelotrema lepadinum]|nr:Carbon-nitrogen hydrolase [Thelotrema lepadinum]
MIVATLQFAPRLGEVMANAKRADEILSSTANIESADLIVCPEMALSGYNFDSLESIRPYLEPSCSGPTALWAFRAASRFKCLVTAGYPETTENPSQIPSKVPFDLSMSVPEAYIRLQESNEVKESTNLAAYFNYNATLTVDPSGNIVAHYRKSFLYYTDATWSLPSPTGFLTVPLTFPDTKLWDHQPPESSIRRQNTLGQGPDSEESLSNHTSMLHTAFGICMDLNPQYFTASWDKRELATHTLTTEASLLVISTAWLTRLPSIFDDPKSSSPGALSDSTAPSKSQGRTESWPCCPTLTLTEPDSESLTYWLDRLSPLIEADRETLVVVANRVGVESGIVRACKLDEIESSEKFLASRSGYPSNNHQAQDDELDQGRKEQIEANHAGAEPTAEFTKLVDQDGVGGIVSTSAHYAGTSLVMALGEGKVRVFGMLGRGEERMLVTDTRAKEQICLSLKATAAHDDT